MAVREVYLWWWYENIEEYKNIVKHTEHLVQQTKQLQVNSEFIYLKYKVIGHYVVNMDIKLLRRQRESMRYTLCSGAFRCAQLLLS